MPDRKILLVDDNPKITAISSYLEKLGFKMFNALNGDKALQIINSEKPALVILDMEMPGVDGLQILSMLKTNHKETKVFVFTAHGKEYKKKADKIGYDRYFDKDTYDLNSLLAAIREMFGEEKIAEKKEAKTPGKTAKARLLFIEPSIQMYAFTSGLFDNREFCTGEYERKALYGNTDYLAGVILEELASYQPNIVLINDYAMDEGKILELIGLIEKIKIKPEAIIVHGLFERNATFETQLKMKGVKRCLQNVMNHNELIEMNQKLIEFVNFECMERGLVKQG